MATLHIDGTASRISAATGYIRNGTGHNNSSWNFSYMRRFSIGDTIEIETIKEAGAGTLPVDASLTFFTITKIGL